METNNPVEWTVEENFKFRLSEMTDKLLEWASQPNGTVFVCVCVCVCVCVFVCVRVRVCMCVLGMGDIDILVCNYCEAKIFQLSCYLFSCVYAENCLPMCLNIAKLVMISAIYHDIVRLLLLTIIVSSKNCTILIIGKENIKINKQNQLIAHP